MTVEIAQDLKPRRTSMPRHDHHGDNRRSGRDEMRRADSRRHDDEGPLERVSDTGGEKRSWRDRPDDRGHDAGGTYGARDYSEASRRSLMHGDQRYEDTGVGYVADYRRHEEDYGRGGARHSGYGSSGQGQYGRGGFARGGYGQSGVGQDYGQRDVTRTDAAQGLHPDHDLDPDYLDWREAQMSAYDSDYANWRQQQSRRHDDEYRRWRDQRRSNFHQSFSAWRSAQTGLNTGVNTQAMQPGLGASEGQISHVTGPGPVDGEFDSDPKVVGDRNSGARTAMTGAGQPAESRETSSADGAGRVPGRVGMAPDANPALSNLAGGGSGRSRGKDGDR
jgi:hypothetical protein